MRNNWLDFLDTKIYRYLDAHAKNGRFRQVNRVIQSNKMLKRENYENFQRYILHIILNNLRTDRKLK